MEFNQFTMFKTQPFLQKASRYLLISALALSVACSDDDDDKKPKEPESDNIWEGPELTFIKEKDADWTLPANQDKITDKVTFTRRESGPMYNYQWWIDTFDADATKQDLSDNFWDNGNSEKEFTRSGGTQGVRWAILDNTGADDNEAWESFNMYGKLGNPANFYSFHNIATMLSNLEYGNNIVDVPDDFNVELECTDCSDGEQRLVSGTTMPDLIDKKLGVWLVDEDIYLTLTFTHWGIGEEDNNSVGYKRSTKD